jgi:hypothetical protein
MKWIGNLIHRRRLAAEAAEEVAAHIEEKVADLMDAGMPEKEARHQAAREFGNAMLITETSREVWIGLGWSAWDKMCGTRCAGCGVIPCWR